MSAPFIHQPLPVLVSRISSIKVQTPLKMPFNTTLLGKVEMVCTNCTRACSLCISAAPSKISLVSDRPDCRYSTYNQEFPGPGLVWRALFLLPWYAFLFFFYFLFFSFRWLPFLILPFVWWGVQRLSFVFKAECKLKISWSNAFFKDSFMVQNLSHVNFTYASVWSHLMLAEQYRLNSAMKEYSSSDKCFSYMVLMKCCQPIFSWCFDALLGHDWVIQLLGPSASDLRIVVWV